MSSCCRKKISSPIRELEIISIPICPYVQKCVIVLLQKKVPFKLTYVDLQNKPKWFQDISPMGNVPVLKVTQEDGNVVGIYESTVINEFIDEITPVKLHPEDPLERAQNRSEVELISMLYTDLFQMCCAKNAESCLASRDFIINKLRFFESKCCRSPFWNGSKFSHVDAAIIPFFSRAEIMNKYLQQIGFDVYPKNEFPRISKWSENLLALEVSTKSVRADFEEIFVDFLESMKDTLISTLITNFRGKPNVTDSSKKKLEVPPVESLSANVSKSSCAFPQ